MFFSRSFFDGSGLLRTLSSSYYFGFRGDFRIKLLLRAFSVLLSSIRGPLCAFIFSVQAAFTSSLSSVG